MRASMDAYKIIDIWQAGSTRIHLIMIQKEKELMILERRRNMRDQ